MRKFRTSRRARLMIGSAVGALALSASAAFAETRPITIPAQSLASALHEFGSQTGRPIMFSPAAAAAKETVGVDGVADEQLALAQLLEGTGLTYRREGDAFVIVQPGEGGGDPQSSGAAGDGADGTVEALIVTAQKREEDIQDVPIAISAFTQEALERSQVAGGPDLMTQVPNMTFTKTNFTGYSIQIRGIGTQAISATTDAAVAVAFNNTPFIRNRFFEQEFYDLQRVEVLRGPQGTLYGRNATAGVVNLISQKPTFGYEAKLVGDVANYSSTRLEGMVNVPLVEDVVALRIAGAWTKREGYSTNDITGNPIDGRDLWSTRLSLRFTPTDRFDANLIWEHFQEKDDRLRSGKQLCHQDDRTRLGYLDIFWQGYSKVYSQGCLPASLYSPDSYEAPDGLSLPYYLPLKELFLPVVPGFNPYASLVQSPDLRAIESTVDPAYKANSDVVELQWNYDLGAGLSLTSETSYNYDTIYSMEDYNRFNTASGAFSNNPLPHMTPGPNGGIFCDPQIGCADRVVAVDVSRAKSSQFSQEFRLSSDYEGPFNFSLGANYLRYDTEDKYYVFINTLTMISTYGGAFVGERYPWQVGVSDNRECFTHGARPPRLDRYSSLGGCIYIDPNPIESTNDRGHNYFLSKNPYKLISYAAFGEAYYDITDTLKLTAGLRWTVDQKEAPRIPSWLIAASSVGFSVLAVEEQEWQEPTGRLTLDWKPDLSFTDETLLYASYAHGYKAGGSNPPPAGIVAWSITGFEGGNSLDGQLAQAESAAKPKIFDPEFVNAFEVGAKNTLLDGRMTLNLSAFYYDYSGYQVSQIIDRSAVNYNFDSEVWGLEIEADWRPLENLRLGFKGGYENTRIADGEHAIDIIDRTAGHGPDSDDPWVVLRPFPSFPSNCILPLYTLDRGNGQTNLSGTVFSGGEMGPCEFAYLQNKDPVTLIAYDNNEAPSAPPDPVNYPGYKGYNPKHDVGQNGGEGFFKELGGNELPNAPHFTATLTGDYTIPLPHDWLATLHTDLYYQSEAWTRVFNMEGYDKLKAYTNVNVAAIFTNEEAGWKVMAYVKNVFDRDSITGAFLNSDDTGLTTNVFLTEPRLYGLRVTKDFDGGPWWTGASGTGPFPLWVEIGGTVLRQDAPYASLGADFVDQFPDSLGPTDAAQHRDLDWGDGREVRVTYKPAGGLYSLSGGIRYGRNASGVHRLHDEEIAGPVRCAVPAFLPDLAQACNPESDKYQAWTVKTGFNWVDSTARDREEHVVADFTVGRDVGLGLLDRSTVRAGVRYAEFESTTTAEIDGSPNVMVPDGFGFGSFPATFTHYQVQVAADREFSGLGPALSWDAAQHIWGDEHVGVVDVDWSVAGGVLFGKQETAISGREGSVDITMIYASVYSDGVMPPMNFTPLDVPTRSDDVSVPFVDLKLGLSYEIQRVKIGAGYRWERYFDVLDVGFYEGRDGDRTLDGPYFKLAIGFGG